MYRQLRAHSLQVLRHTPANQRVVIQNDSVVGVYRHDVKEQTMLKW
jgi:hypothetical protein